MQTQSNPTIETRLRHLTASESETPLAPKYNHILIATRMDQNAQPAISLGVGMAIVQRAALTILHIQTVDDRTSSMHWLDGLDRLQTLGEIPISAAADQVKAVVDRIDAQINQLMNGIPDSIRSSINIRHELRTGDLADAVARLADQSSADLVILSNDQAPWWLPVLPMQTRRVMQLLKQPVILVKPDSLPNSP